jgi:bla regulator protein BlaR1
MIIYILKSASCLAMLLAFYHLVLEKEKMHVFNRFYLLGSVLLSFLAPLYIIYINATQ